MHVVEGKEENVHLAETKEILKAGESLLMKSVLTK